MTRWPRIIVVAVAAAAIATAGLALTATAKDRSDVAPRAAGQCSMHTTAMDAMHGAMNGAGMMNGTGMMGAGMMNGASRQVSR